MPKQLGSPVTMFIDTWVNSDLWRTALAQVGVPLLRILAIITVAFLLRRIVERVINEAMDRVKTPPADLTLTGLTERARDYMQRKTVDAQEPAIESIRREQRANSLGGLARSVANVTIVVSALIMVLSELGLELAPLLAGAGIVGLAFGFGAQDLVKDFLSGVFMLLEDQFGVGDIIEVGGNTGVVEAVSLRSTRLRSVDGTLWHVPNGDIRQVGNRSQEWARALFDVDVSYDTDVDVALSVVGKVVTDLSEDPEFSENFLEEPTVVGVMALGTDAVTLRAMAQVVPGQQWALGREFSRRIKRAFDTARIEFPFPQRTVWLRTERPLALGDAHAPVWEAAQPDQASRDAARHAAPINTAGEPDDRTAGTKQ